MTDARRTELNYGHFGEPVYDVESHEWHFSRKTQDVPQLQRLGESRLVVPPQLSSNSGEAISTAVQRDSEIEQLARAYPELAPSSGLLPSLAEESEAIQKSTSAYDPAISDLLAFGRALHPLHHRQSEKTVPVIAIAGGSAGGLVRVFQLVPEVIGWDEQSNIKLQDEAFRGRVQGLWYGNGSRIQQLQFARSNGEPTEWLAVRYGGTTSILRVILRDREVPTLYDIPHPPALQADVEIRLEVKHIVTVSMQLSRGVPHADVCFNPCNPQEFAIVNQSSRWSTWRVASINKKVDVWIAEAGVSGHLTGDKSDDNGDPEKSNTHLDGWGAVRWINYGNCLLVCNRRRISCCKLQDSPTYFSLPELGLKKTKDWILDIKEASTNPEHIFVVTSSCIFWLQLTFERLGDDDQLQLCAKTLLTWRHFRNELDASLSMQLVVLGSMTKVLLCSRLTGLTTVFTFDIPQSSSKPPSSLCDPYLFPDHSHDDLPKSGCSALALRVLRHENHDGRITFRAGSRYLKIVTLGHDLSLRECFMVANPHNIRHSLGAPQTQGRSQPMRKSSYRIVDEFFVPNGMLDIDVQDNWSICVPSLSNKERVDELDAEDRGHPLSTDPWTINLEWVTEHITSTLSTPLSEALQPVLSRVSERLSARIPGIVSLEEMIDEEIAVGDVEEDSTALESLLSTLQGRQFSSHEDSLDLPEQTIPRAKLTTVSLPFLLHAAPGRSLSETYDALVKSWITPLSSDIPGRVRTRYERIIRGIAAELQLASCGVRIQAREDEAERQSQSIASQELPTFTLPVRGMPAASQEFRPVRAKAVEQAFAQSASSQTSNNQGFSSAAGLPTPEPTPSLRSQGSQSTQGESEDPAVQRLRALANIAPQPPLPAAVAGILSHWAVGQNPDDYDWERSQEIVERGEKPEDAEEAARAKKRRRKERLAHRHIESAVASSSQAMPIRPAASQADAHSDQPYSSQLTPVTASQPQPGPFGSRKPLKKPDKRPGFR